MVLASFESPYNLPLARELWHEDATAALTHVRIPTLVLIGGRDIQIDRHLDGDPLQSAASGMANVSFAFPEHANHVFQYDDSPSLDAAKAAAGRGYNALDARLDPEALTTILHWLTALFA
jgi:fermentation-respiration switch protein FrsA (DUF1100 family)